MSTLRVLTHDNLIPVFVRYHSLEKLHSRKDRVKLQIQIRNLDLLSAATDTNLGYFILVVKKTLKCLTTFFFGQLSRMTGKP